MINGDGFFLVNAPSETLYTRSGAFKFDATGNLVTPTGAFVQGYDRTAGGCRPAEPARRRWST